MGVGGKREIDGLRTSLEKLKEKEISHWRYVSHFQPSPLYVLTLSNPRGFSRLTYKKK